MSAEKFQWSANDLRRGSGRTVTSSDTRTAGLGGQFAPGGGRVPGKGLTSDPDMIAGLREQFMAKSQPIFDQYHGMLDKLHSNKAWERDSVSYKDFREVQLKAQAAGRQADKLAGEELELRLGGKSTPKPLPPEWEAVQAKQSGVRNAPVSDSGLEPAVFQKYRDRYVVADVPTLNMNAALRGEMELTAGLKARVREATKMTAGTLTEPTVLHRTMELPPHVAATMTAGTVWESKGFQSTQFGGPSPYNRSGENPGNVHVSTTLLAPAGTHAADVAIGEVVLRPGRSRVVDSAWDGEVLNVTMEVLP